MELVTETARAHFVLRRFNLHGWQGECVVSRPVSHWQFLRWTDSGCSTLPHHPLQFLDLVRDVQTKHCADTGLLVHCAVGAGPSGLFLAVDALSTEGRRTGQVDVEQAVTLLCLERMNLVQTFRQYRYIYHCLIELFDAGHETCIPVSCFHFTYTNLMQRGKQTRLSRLDREFCVLSLPCYGLCTARRSNQKTPPPHDGQCNDNNDNNYNNDNDYHYNYNNSAGSDNRTWMLDGYLTSRLYVIPRGGLQHADEFWQTLVDHNARTAVVLCPLEQSGLSVPCQGQSIRVGTADFALECR